MANDPNGRVRLAGLPIRRSRGLREPAIPRPGCVTPLAMNPRRRRREGDG